MLNSHEEEKGKLWINQAFSYCPNSCNATNSQVMNDIWLKKFKSIKNVRDELDEAIANFEHDIENVLQSDINFDNLYYVKFEKKMEELKDFDEDTIKKMKENLKKIDIMIEMNVHGISAGINKASKICECWCLHELSHEKEEFIKDLDNYLSDLIKLSEIIEENLSSFSNLSSQKKIKEKYSDAFKSNEEKLKILQKKFLTKIEDIPELMKKFRDDVQAFVTKVVNDINPPSPSLILKGVSSWKIINKRRYLNSKIKEHPDMLEEWNPKNTETVSKGLSDIFEEAYKEDKKDLKNKQTKLQKLVWENAVSSSKDRLHISHQNLLIQIYEEYKKKNAPK